MVDPYTPFCPRNSRKTRKMNDELLFLPGFELFEGHRFKARTSCEFRELPKSNSWKNYPLIPFVYFVYFVDLYLILIHSSIRLFLIDSGGKRVYWNCLILWCFWGERNGLNALWKYRMNESRPFQPGADGRLFSLCGGWHKITKPWFEFVLCRGQTPPNCRRQKI
jgi:hypothetical protein